MTRVIGRSEWGARFRDGFGSRSIAGINSWWLHHSATAQLPTSASFNQDAAAVRSIESIGQSRFNGGISYTYLITPSGRIFQGHSLGRIGSHTAGYNTRGVGICLVGNYDTNQPSSMQIDAVVWLLKNVLGNNLSGGHRDIKGTACPGSYAYSMIPSIRAAFSDGAVQVLDQVITTPPAPGWVGSSTTLRRGSSGTAVRNLQDVLNRRYPLYSKLVVDGEFGPATEKVVKEFQRRSLITVDGIVGPVTAEKLGITLSSTPAPLPAPAPVQPKNADGSLRLDIDGIRGPATIARWQQVMGTPIDGVISRPRSTLIEADQRFLNSVISPAHGMRLVVDGDEGHKTIRARQFWLRNAVAAGHQQNLIGRMLDFDGVLGPQTNKVHQFALNNARSGSGRYGN